MIPTTTRGLGTLAVFLIVTGDNAPDSPRAAVASDGHGRSVTAPVCSLAVISRTRIVLADGQVVHLAVQSTARQGRTILLAGMPSYTWPSGASPGAAPQTRDSLVGVLVTDGREIRGVPNPLVGRAIAYAKVASAGRGAWHVMLSERLTIREGHEQATDSARLWYGRFDGRAWSDVASVGVVHGSFSAKEYTSDVVVDEAGVLAFAYPIDAQVGSTAISGVVLIRRVEHGWSADTLGKVLQPRYTRLVPGPRPGEWTVLYVAPFFENQRLINSSLHAVVWSGRWDVPRVMVRAVERGVVNPRPFPLRAGLLLTWFRRAERTDSGTAPRIEWLMATSGTTHTSLRRPVIIGSNDYTATALGADSVLWFARDGLSPDRVRVAAFGGDTIAALGTLRIRNETWLAAIGLPGHGVGLITSEVGKEPAEPPAAGILTVVKPVCPTG